VTPKTLARWLTNLLELAGIDTSKFKSHNTRAASAAHLKTTRSLTVKEICQRADWSTLSGVYKRFYEKIVEH
jgi:hypothetical protein